MKPTERREPAILLIGGLDPTGQAGIGRDLTALARMDLDGLRGCPISTGIVTQTSADVQAIRPTTASDLHAQIDAACTEHHVTHAKIGALLSAAQVETVADAIAAHDITAVLDPVLTTTSGTTLLGHVGTAALRHALIPRSILITPNQAEAQRLTGLPAGTDPTTLGQALLGRGAHAILITQSGQAPDILITNDGTTTIDATHRPGRHRGTGCRLSTRITALLHHGLPLHDAIPIAQTGLQSELEHDAALQDLDEARRRHLHELRTWWPRILHELDHAHIPEVGMNIAYALPGAKDPRRDVLGLAGRITIAGYDKATTGRLVYGGPHHTGRIAIVLQEHDPDARLVMNHRYDPAYLDAARTGGLTASGFQRADEPPDAPSSMEWGVRSAIRHNDGRVPDIIYDTGGDNKEAMIRIIATDPQDLVRKLRILHHTRGQAVGDADGRDEVDPVLVPHASGRTA